jgi:hypothetical protein
MVDGDAVADSSGYVDGCSVGSVDTMVQNICVLADGDQQHTAEKH